MAQAQQMAPPTGIINTAFVDAEEEDEDEGELVDDVDGMEQSVPVERYLKKNAGQLHVYIYILLYVLYMYELLLYFILATFLILLSVKHIVKNNENLQCA